VKQLDGLVAKVQERIERNRSYKNIAALLVRQNAHGSLLQRRAQLGGGASAADFPAAPPLRLTPRPGYFTAQIFTIVYIVVLFLQRNPTESYQVASPRARRQPAEGKGGHEDPSPPLLDGGFESAVESPVILIGAENATSRRSRRRSWTPSSPSSQPPAGPAPPRAPRADSRPAAGAPPPRAARRPDARAAAGTSTRGTGRPACSQAQATSSTL